MAKKRKGRASLTTSKRRPKGKVAARNKPVRPLKEKKTRSAVKRGKGKSKGRSTLHAKGGGHATWRVLPASVGAVFAVQLTESQVC